MSAAGPISSLRPGERFRVVDCDLAGRVVSVTECAVSVEVERGLRSFRAHDEDDREVEVKLKGSTRRFTIACSTTVERVDSKEA